MSTNPGDFIIIDGANIKGANLIDKLDALVRPGRQFIIPNFVLDEVGRAEGPGRQALQSWIDRQKALGNISNLADNFSFDVRAISAADAAKYGTDPGDAGIKKWLSEAAPTGKTYTVFTDDRKLGAFGKELLHVKPMGGIASFMAHDNLLSDEARSKASAGDNSLKENYKKFMWDGDDAFAKGERASKPSAARILTQEGVDNFDAKKLSADDLTKLSDNLKTIGGKFAQNFMGVLNEAAKGLGAIGFLFFIMDAAVTEAKASDLYEENDTDGGNKLWVEFLFEAAGGSILGAAGLLVGAGWLSIPIAIGLGYLGSLLGKELGSFLYEQNREEFNSFMADVRGFIPDGEDVDASDYIEQLISYAFADLILDSNEVNGAKNVAVFTEPDEVYGGNAGDFLIGWKTGFISAGAPIEPDDPNSKIAPQDLRLVLDGGSGDDRIFAFGGEKAITIGGPGRDWIFNTSKGGAVFGDTIDGLDPETGAKFEDSKENSDSIWFWPNVNVVDAGHHDILSFFGMPLTGGNIEAGGAFAVARTSIGGYTGGGLGWAGFQTTIEANKNAEGKKPGWTGGLFWDNLLPFINYVFDINTHSLYVTNYVEALSGFFITGKTDMFRGTSKTDNPDTPEDETKNLTGFMRIDNFDLIATLLGALQQQSTSSSFGGNGYENYQGTLNMVFKQINPVAVILDMLPPTAITFGIQAKYGGSPLIDAAAARDSNGFAGRRWRDPSQRNARPRQLRRTVAVRPRMAA